MAISVQAAVLLVALLSVASATRKGARVFSEDYVEGLYGRFFEFTNKGNSQPCPHVIDHFNRGGPSALGNSWIVPHDLIVQNGALCDDGGKLVLSAYNSTSVVPEALEASEIAKQTFDLMKEDSTGFWMGADDRTCGKWVFPNPSYIFFVREFDRKIKSFFNLSLSPGKKYMFIVAPTFSCIYEDIPRRRPSPTIEITNPDGTTSPTPNASQSPTIAGSSEQSPKEPPVSGDVEASASPIQAGQTESPGTAETTNPNATPTTSSGSSGTATGSTAPSEDSTGSTAPSTPDPNDNVSIQDVQNGTPVPGATPESSDTVSIQDIQTDEPQPESGNEGNENESINDISSDDDDGDDVGDTDAGESGESLCFPADAMVELSSGSHVRMEQVSIGDEVRVGPSSFSQVYMFTHRMELKKTSFVQLRTAAGYVRLTGGHLLYVNDRLRPAGAVRVGDLLRTGSGDHTRVLRVNSVQATGVYNPQTVHGDIVVDGIITSTYTASIKPSSAHSMLAPFRALWGLLRAKCYVSVFESHSVPNHALSLLRFEDKVPMEQEL